MEALVIARTTSPAWDILHLLSRAGFSVDIVTTSRHLRLSRFARTVHSVTSDKALAPSAYDVVRIRGKPYDWVIATDDLTLRALALLEWPPGMRLKFLPSSTPENLPHLCSKIGLSRVLSAGGIRTPPFRIARNHEEAIEAASAIGYPVMLKVDFSGGGQGVHECAKDADIVALRHLFTEQPLLVQKKIEGTTLDLSAIYFDGELVHFTYSTCERRLKQFGLSVVRTYYPLALVDGEIFTELSALGNVLAASGFVNITCIEAADGTRQYIEADMRPNAWADFSRFFGERRGAKNPRLVRQSCTVDQGKRRSGRRWTRSADDSLFLAPGVLGITNQSLCGLAIHPLSRSAVGSALVACKVPELCSCYRDHELCSS